MKIIFEEIGIIETPFKTEDNMPIQSKGAKGVKGKIILKEEFVLGLHDLNDFSHIMLLYYFHKSKGFNLKTKPFLDDTERGVFATRAPKRPNGIGVSIVKLTAIKNNILCIENVDMLNGTPLLDIKPYIGAFDIHNVEKKGWIANKIKDLNAIKSDKRFTNDK